MANATHGLRPFSWRALDWASARAKHDPAMVHEVWVEERINDEWLAAFRLYEADGMVGVAELRVFPLESDRPFPGRWSAETDRQGVAARVPPGGLTARIVRQARFAVTRSFTTQALREAEEKMREAGIADFARHFRVFAPNAAVRRPTAGRNRWTDLELARLAARYVALVMGEKSTIGTLAKERHLSEGAVKKALKLARDRRLLTATPRRRAGGSLTDRALELLQSSG